MVEPLRQVPTDSRHLPNLTLHEAPASLATQQGRSGRRNFPVVNGTHSISSLGSWPIGRSLAQASRFASPPLPAARRRLELNECEPVEVGALAATSQTGARGVWLLGSWDAGVRQSLTRIGFALARVLSPSSNVGVNERHCTSISNHQRADRRQCRVWMAKGRVVGPVPATGLQARRDRFAMYRRRQSGDPGRSPDPGHRLFRRSGSARKGKTKQAKRVRDLLTWEAASWQCCDAWVSQISGDDDAIRCAQNGQSCPDSCRWRLQETIFVGGCDDDRVLRLCRQRPFRVQSNGRRRRGERSTMVLFLPRSEGGSAFVACRSAR